MLYHGRALEDWVALFRSDEKGRDEAGAVFLTIGTAAVGPLSGLLDQAEAPITRAVAASTLWLMRQRAAAAVPILERTLAKDPDVVVRLRAAQALTGIVGPTHAEAVSYLRQTAGSQDPGLAQWIKVDARMILRDAGVPE